MIIQANKVEYLTARWYSNRTPQHLYLYLTKVSTIYLWIFSIKFFLWRYDKKVRLYTLDAQKEPIMYYVIVCVGDKWTCTDCIVHTLYCSVIPACERLAHIQISIEHRTAEYCSWSWTSLTISLIKEKTSLTTQTK